jgi:release factor glutamine methyltransferase
MKSLRLQNKLSKNEQYNPAEDTFFLEDCIKNEKGYSALDIGSGSGYLTKILEKSFSLVIGTDINSDVLKNQTYKTQNLVCCNSADAMTTQFDLIICNLPYLATEDIFDIATDGGKEGLEIPLPMIKSAFSRIKPGGKFLFVTSSLSNYSKLIDFCKQGGLEAKILAKKKLFFEELIVIEAKKLFS